MFFEAVYDAPALDAALLRARRCLALAKSQLSSDNSKMFREHLRALEHRYHRETADCRVASAAQMCHTEQVRSAFYALLKRRNMCLLPQENRENAARNALAALEKSIDQLCAEVAIYTARS